MDLEGKKITVIGLGERTGVSLVRYLSKVGAKIFVTEMKKKEDVMGSWHEVSGINAEFEFGGHSLEKVKGSMFAVLCPGVPIDSPFVQRIKNLGVEVMSELELAYRLIQRGKIIGVTGTNGKSTTVTMLGDILSGFEKRSFVGGNLGTPLIEALGGKDGYDIHVVEVSTFQLEGTREFRPDIGILLNISRNHIDRHKSFERYKAMKSAMFANSRADDIAVMNMDDPVSMSVAPDIRCKKVFFSLGNSDADVFFEGGSIKGSLLGRDARLDMRGFSLAGKHNISNFMAATAAALSLGCPLEKIGSAAKGLKGLPHRNEFVRELEGVRYLDDSKSTTVDSTVKAILSAEKNVVLIAGGRDKGADFSLLKGHMDKRIKAVVLYGEASGRMEKELKGTAPVHVRKRFEDAVVAARDIAERGDTVLLSPACASFDQFKNYEERGMRFKDIVRGF